MKRFIYALMIIAYCVCYNIIQHGTETDFFIGLAAAVAAVMCMNYCFKNGFRIVPESEAEPDYFDTYFTDTEGGQ